ncbi:DNA-binding HxlR family transcriptional regulator [Devosia sp. UYZn731]|uniref:winged helix-turn-helix transcriptional regulator n=1 Tax=Devosia sp. UYZn731 TaxID=3156345 RepID=UPI0033920AB9
MTKYLFKNAATHLPEYCRPTGEILAMLGDKWSVAILGNLSKGRVRFSELENLIEGISQRMLTLTLRSLERDGLVARIVTPTVPARDGFYWGADQTCAGLMTRAWDLY